MTREREDERGYGSTVERKREERGKRDKENVSCFVFFFFFSLNKRKISNNLKKKKKKKREIIETYY